MRHVLLVLSFAVLTTIAPAQPTAITWTKYPAPNLSGCSDIAVPPCVWAQDQGFVVINPDGVNGGVWVYGDRQPQFGAVTVTGGTNVAWTSGDKFSFGWALAAGDQITINGTAYPITQGSVTPTALTLTTSAPNGTWSYSTSSGPGTLTSSTDVYEWRTTSHSFVYLGGSGTLTQPPSGTQETDSPTWPGGPSPWPSTWPADRQVASQELYDSSRGAIWLTGGVNSSHFWDCMDTSAVPCYTGGSETVWRQNLSTKVWTALSPAHQPVSTDAEQAVAIDTDDQIVMQAGYNLVTGFNVNLYCPTDLNPTPGTLTPNQTTAGCIQTGGTDDWCPFGFSVCSAKTTSGVTMPFAAFPQLFYSTHTHLFYLFFGTTPASVFLNHVYSYAPLTKTWTQVDTGTGCPMTTPAAGFKPQGVTMLLDGTFLYHYTGTPSADWIFDPSAGSCTQITTAGSSPSIAGAPGVDVVLAQDPVTGTLVAWPQGGMDYSVWEGVLATAPVITTTSPLPTGQQYAAYSVTLTALYSPTSWAITSGSLPTGLALNPSTGAISGVPMQGGSWSITITATNGNGTSSPVTFSLPITVTPGLGGSTYNCVDADNDGYGVGSGCSGPDADDTDATVVTYSDVIAKWTTLAAFWTHMGWNPASVYFVDGGSGTCTATSSPFVYNSATACGTVDTAISAMSAGDGVVVRASATSSRTTQLGLASGNLSGSTCTNYDYFLTYPGEEPVFTFSSGGSATNGVSAGGTQSCFYLDGWELIQPSAFQGIGAGITVSNTSPVYGVTLSHVDVTGFAWNVFPQGYQIGTQILHSFIHGAYGGSDYGHDIYLGSNFTGSTGSIIRANVIADANDACLHINGPMTSVMVDSNLMYGCSKGINNQDGLSHSTVQNNIIHTNAGNLFLISSYCNGCATTETWQCKDQNYNIIRNNTFYEDGQSWNPSGATPDSGNATLFVGDDGTCQAAIGYTPDIGNNTFDNNIWYHYCGPGLTDCSTYIGPVFRFPNGLTFLSTETFNNNVIRNVDDATTVIDPVGAFNTAQPCSYFVANTLGGSNQCNVEPNFVAGNPAWSLSGATWNLQVLAGSPALGTADASDIPTYDAIGYIRSLTTPTVGAYEIAGGLGPTFRNKSSGVKCAGCKE